MKSHREHARAPILTQVEAGGPELASLGRARDLSVGGLLVESSETLPQGAEVIIRFRIPPDTRPVELVGRVVRSEPGTSMAIAFVGLAESLKQRILAYVQESQQEQAATPPVEPSAGGASRRRSARLPRRIAVVLNWQDEAGRGRQEPAETKLVSRYGALLTSYSQLESGRVLRLSLPERGSEARSRVIYSAAAELPGRTEVAIEFIGGEDFWKIPFPADAATLLLTRRRSQRRRQKLALELIRETPGGIRHQEASETLDISRHGVRLTAANLLEPERVIELRRPDTGRRATARVVWWRIEADLPNRVQMGLELLGTDDFWGIAFEPDRDYSPPETPPK